VSFFEDSFGFAGFGSITDPSYVPTLLNGSPGTGGWATGGGAAMVVTGAHRCRGSFTGNCNAVCTVNPGVDEYDVACDFFHRLDHRPYGRNQHRHREPCCEYGLGRHVGVRFGASGRRHPYQSECNPDVHWDVITTIATVSGTDWSGGQDYHCVMKVRKNSAHSFQVTVTITRTADEKYLKSDGTWQSSPQNVIDVAYDDSTPASINHGLADIGNGSVAVSEFDYSGESAGVHIDNVVMSGVVTSGITVNPTSIVNHSTGNLITITGIGTSWTPGTPGTPTFAVDSGTITAQTVSSGTTATITLSAPATNGTITVTDPSTGETATISVVDPATLLAGTATFDHATPTAATLEASAASGGTPPITIQWQRCATATGSFANVPGMTGSVAADSAISAGTDYFWRPVYTDHVAQTVNGNVIPGRLWDEVPLILSFIGDSWTTSAHCNGVVSYVSKVAGHLRKVTLGRNEGIGGTGVVTWDPSSGLYDGSLDAALPRLIAAGTQVISLLMGTNDVSNSTSASEWSTRLVNICNYMFAHGLPDVKVVLHCPAFRNGSGATGEQLLLEYRNILPSVCNGTNILLGTRLMFDYFSSHEDELLPGELHPNDAVGSVSVQFMVANSIANALYATSGGFLTEGSRMPRLLRP
jgi:hypothetical protein